MSDFADLERRIGGVLSASAADLRLEDPGSWCFRLAGVPPLAGSAHLELPWLVIELGLGRGAGPPWELLRRNAGLTGPIKFALSPRARRPALVAEIHADDGPTLEGDLAGILAAVAGLLAGGERQADPAPPVALETETDRLRRGCAEAGWRCAEGKGGRPLAVALETNGRSHRARLATSADDRLIATVTLAEPEILERVCREALALLLLAASGTIRLVRAAVVEGAAGTALLFQVDRCGPVTPADLDDVLSALSVACRVCGLEVEALLDPTLAGRYVEVWGRSPRLRANVRQARESRRRRRRHGKHDGRSTRPACD